MFFYNYLGGSGRVVYVFETKNDFIIDEDFVRELEDAVEQKGGVKNLVIMNWKEID